MDMKNVEDAARNAEASVEAKVAEVTGAGKARWVMWGVGALVVLALVYVFLH